MKKVVLDEAIRPQVIHRIMKLLPDSGALWGHFSVSEMMFHCAAVNNTVLQSEPNKHTPTMRQRVMRIVVLNLMKHLPKGIKTSDKYLKPKEDKSLFEDERKRLMESVNNVVERKDKIYGTHPLLGPLDTTGWRRILYMHLDHHLRQFGV